MSNAADPNNTPSQTNAPSDRRPAVPWTRSALHNPCFFSAEARPSPTATKTSFCLWAEIQQKDAECGYKEEKDKTILRVSVWKHIRLFCLNQKLSTYRQWSRFGPKTDSIETLNQLKILNYKTKSAHTFHSGTEVPLKYTRLSESALCICHLFTLVYSWQQTKHTLT